MRFAWQFVAALQLTLASATFFVPSAAGAPVRGRHATIENRFTTTLPGAPSGFRFTATYHAAGDARANPPYMRKMTFYAPRGLRYDTDVPAKCTASDLELAVRGAAACPAASRLGGGISKARFMSTFPTEVTLDFFNNRNEQIILGRSPGLATVTRGKIRRDQSVEFAAPTCFPALQPLGCPVDNVLQLSSKVVITAYAKRNRGRILTWLRTPPRCPASRHWNEPVRLWWADGTTDTVVTRSPCRRVMRRRGGVAR